ncbi:MAG: hypothetical protein NTV32_00765, partial [Gammaproteobacteria bacterium]|nr:hypothetical protein [Gammaproteobacteria bacterium]
MMFDSSKKEPDLIRLHWDQGGVEIDYGQPFKFVSPDVFVNIDRSDASKIFRVTRKLNIGISIDPNCCSAEVFFRFFSCGLKSGILMDSFESDALKTEAKCEIHGDAQTGLVASLALKKILKESGLNEEFLVNDDVYSYDSIGVAANGRYAGVDHREGNSCYNKSSHFEIKFRRTSPPKIGAPEVEFLCLNMHLTAKATFKFESALERLKLGLRLFREELGIAPRTYRGLKTQL